MRMLIAHSDLWLSTWRGLQQRGGGAREAACVWLGTIAGDVEHAREIVFLDDLPGTTAQRLNHRTSREAVNMVLGRARVSRQRIVADIHTHPADWVDLSVVDRAHPIEYRLGLLALVLPDFAEGPCELSRAGVHEYLGDGRWGRFDGSAKANRVRLDSTKGTS